MPYYEAQGFFMVSSVWVMYVYSIVAMQACIITAINVLRLLVMIVRLESSTYLLKISLHLENYGPVTMCAIHSCAHHGVNVLTCIVSPTWGPF